MKELLAIPSLFAICTHRLWLRVNCNKKNIANEISALGEYEKANISDIFKGAIKGKIQAGFGNGKSYRKMTEIYR